MKKQIAAFILITSLGAFSLPAQSPRSDQFDARKSQQELEIMRGIISTTLEFAAREMQGAEEKSTGGGGKFKVRRFGLWGHDVDAYYFYGQGATFIVPVSGLRLGVLAELEDVEAEVAGLKAEAAVMAYEAQRYATGAHAGVPPAPPAPAAAPAPPQPPQAPAPAVAPTPIPAPEPRAVREDTRVRLREAQEQVKRRRETSLEREKRLGEMVAQAKGYLIEAVANHGDSLTFLKPNEYINVVISADGKEILGDSDGSAGRQIISVQKSAITEYKAGRLSLDAFKQKVLQYTN